jgi:hypothetical protein
LIYETAASNNSFNRSGDSISFMVLPAMSVVWIRAARLIRALCASISIMLTFGLVIEELGGIYVS